MIELLYFLAGLLVAALGIAITLRVHPKKRLCGFVESTSTFDRKWVFSSEKVKILFDDVEAERVIHHVFYLWNGGSSAIRSTDLPNAYVAKIAFSGEHIELIESRKIGTAFDMQLHGDGQQWLITADHMDKGHAVWCHFVEIVPLDYDPSAITIEGYVIEGGEMITEVRPISAILAIRVMRIPVGICLFLALMLVIAVQMGIEDAWVLVSVSALVCGLLALVNLKWLIFLVTGYRFRVPSEFNQIWGRFEAHWSRREVESRLGVRFPQ